MQSKNIEKNEEMENHNRSTTSNETESVKLNKESIGLDEFYQTFKEILMPILLPILPKKFKKKEYFQTHFVRLCSRSWS